MSVDPEYNKKLMNNIFIHNKIAKKYEENHSEIFNVIEQERLRSSLNKIIKEIRLSKTDIKALDFGCGSGNLTKHLLDSGLSVTAADVSSNFLELVKYNYSSKQLSTYQLNGRDLSDINSNTFDLIATYSVLHHIPDYLAIIKEFARVCKPGGIIYIDHESNEDYWSNNLLYSAFKREATRINWRKYFQLSNYVHKAKSWMIPKYTNEGDLHVWIDDHIEWKLIEQQLMKFNFEVVLKEDYLLYNSLYRKEIYEKYQKRCTDTRVMAFRKIE